MGSRQPAPHSGWLAIRSPENSVNSLPVIWMWHTKGICCLFVSCGRLVTVFKEVVSETLPERTSRSVIFKTLTMPRTPWKAFLTSGFCEQWRGLQAEEGTDYYSMSGLVGMNNLRVIPVKEQMSKTNWQPFFPQSTAHFPKVSSVVCLSKFWNLHFPFYISHRLWENTVLGSVKGTCAVLIDNPLVFYSLGGTLKSQTVLLQSVAGSEQKSVNTALALPGAWVT